MMMNKNDQASSTVELRAAKIPAIGLIAVHYWFVIHQEKQTERWEVWQKPRQNTASSSTLNSASWGHLHKNLLAFDRGVGNGDSWTETRWQGDVAYKLIDVLRASATDYPECHRYHYWPGPNSNTYVQWILNQADCDHQLLPQGIGKNHQGWWGWQRAGRCTAFSTPLFGFKYIPSKYFEWHFLHLALSVQRNPWRVRTFLKTFYGTPSL
ncbi:MAG: hypothetical protein ACI8WB_001600 [Phenylobacterium sp.]|jgi:hypothetical protein